MPRSRSEFDALYERHYRHVVAYCTRRVGPIDAPAAANEVMSIAWRRVADMPAAGDEVRPWLYGVARKVVGHHWRGTRRRRKLQSALRGEGGVATTDPGTVIVMRDELERVLSAAAALGESDQEILRLAGWEGLSHREIAGILGCSVAAVDQRFHRAKRRLAEKYAALEHAGALRRALGAEGGGGRSP